MSYGRLWMLRWVGLMPSFGAAGDVYGDPVSLASSAARTATGTGSPVFTGEADTARLTLSVTAASGTTPSATVAVQTSVDASTWATVGSFTAATGVTSERKVFSGLDRYVRASWTITGTTPSLTFALSGELI